MKKPISNITKIWLAIMIFMLSGFFLLDIKITYINICSLFAILISCSFILFAVTLLMQDYKNILHIAGIIGSTFLYAITILISVAFSNFFKDTIGTFIFIEILINIIYLFTLIAVIHFGNKKSITDSKATLKLEKSIYGESKRGGF